ncbi:MAG: hypothetical protein QGF28_03640 [Candidatus Thalassarchaeaceae archaeon]|nr:hypothetical protein [Euryarchaeota archaeon]MDP6220262.1 hypothetical protein [Candidatus Thalassarchaeaceae archaeon]MBV43290.1 hypothetical protein [Euryarchaeota archaeon]MDP7091485.1 hypothetical protein [Candidatus Thalassarchaeaceae archaeon]MDP7257450.1 hypothetical protein [Candidatus Thalassarchaeaceae archaeon]
MTDERRGRRVEDLPDWARRLYEEYGSPELEGLGDVFHGPLMDRKSGLRKDDLIEVLLDIRMLPEDREPWVRGMLIGTTRNAIEILDQRGDFRSVARDVIVEVRLITHLRRTYIEDRELLKFEKDDMRRRSEMHEKAEKTGEGYESSLWG